MPRCGTPGAWPWPIFIRSLGKISTTLAQELGLGFPPLEGRILYRQLATGSNSPLTTSAGRLFDAVAAALNICRHRTYEGQPAIELEMAADPEEEGFYPAPIRWSGDSLILDTLTIFRRVMDEYRFGIDPGKIAARFHNSMVRLFTAACELVRDQTGLDLVALSGGVFQNALLLTRLRRFPGKTEFPGADPRLDPAQRRLHRPGPGGRGRGAANCGKKW